MKIGLVLGAGGLTGQAYHAGVLAALAETGGWDPRTAEVIVGTSAGSAVGSYLRFGLQAPDFAALLTQGVLSDEGRALVDRLGPSGDWTEPTKQRTWAPPHPRLLSRLVRTPWKVRPEALLGCAIPTGRMDTESWTAALRPIAGTDWPDRPLWLCAVRMDDARRIVFGREGSPRVDVATAIGASCAIPGVFAPVTIHGRRYVDGGVHAPTNADVLRDTELDLVVVSSPMSMSRRASARRPSRAARGHFRARLGQELRRLGRAGIPSVVYQPSEADLEVMGGRAMDPDRVAHVVAQAHATTVRRLGERPLPVELPHRG
ncbi:MAG: patatin-like phospholipase family protein [Acidimicrobiia bacterium]